MLFIMLVPFGNSVIYDSVVPSVEEERPFLCVYSVICICMCVCLCVRTHACTHVTLNIYVCSYRIVALALPMCR